MSRSLVVDLVEEQPVVLLIGDDRSSRRCLENLLQQQSLEISAVTEAEVVELSPDPTYYKIIWLQLLPTDTEQTRKVIRWLGQRTEPVTVVTQVVSPIQDDRQPFVEWRNRTQEQTVVLSLIQEYLPEATLLVGQDVMTTAETFSPFKTMTHYLERQSLIDPGVLFCLQTFESFCQAIKLNVLSPLPHTVLVQGRKISSTELIHRLQLEYQHHQGINLTTENISAEPGNLESWPTVTNPAGENAEIFVKTIPKAFPFVRRHPPLNSAEHLPSPRPDSVKKPKNSPPQSRRIISLEPPSKTTTNPVANQASSRRNSSQTTNLESSVEQQVVNLFQQYRTDHTVKRVQNLAHETKHVSSKLTHKKKLFWGGVAFISAGLGVVVLTLVFFISSFLLQRSVVDNLKDGFAQGRPVVAGKMTTILASAVETQVGVYSSVLDESWFDKALQMSRLVSVNQKLLKTSQELDDLTQKATLSLFGRGQTSSLPQWQQTTVVAKQTYDDLSDAQTISKNLSKLSLSPQLYQQLGSYQTWVAQEKKKFFASQQLQPLLPSLLGETEKKTYAIVFQNNQELRPTGGFIQAVALITIDQGTIINTSVLNAYDVDKKVPGLVAPPPDVTKYLGEQQWFLRDSNWNPDFSTTSTQITWFLERGTNQAVDGVIGLNLLSLKEILKAVGPLELPEYNEVLTDRNLEERMEFHSEIQLVPNAAQPDYATLVLTKLVQKTLALEPDKIGALFRAVQDQFDQKQLLVSLKNLDENQTLLGLGWTGALLKPACPAQLAAETCLVDTVAQVEANVGVNKANAYIKRTIHHETHISRQEIAHRRTMTFENTATTPAWPKGTYKNYLRLYVSPEARLKQVSINGQTVSSSALSLGLENKRQVIGFLVEVPVASKAEVSVEYTLPSPSAQEFAYTLFDQRQPGIPDPQLSITMVPDPALKPAVIAPQADVVNGQIRFAPSTEAHSFVGALFR